MYNIELTNNLIMNNVTYLENKAYEYAALNLKKVSVSATIINSTFKNNIA